ncbi:MAG: hypothetical protein A2622_00815 [Bdellovibrionales bacterium RIFCSPHIGHO2_01_FULL_40_29]|nr:MAG: hypothetical protein A2622_00815 [Bdellovibrionales bacterium RIFCSPHIGHO2_01_FULL_40_29]OFZ32659.1 MAG: hypothetical protein A3D17_05415 [Bdellovibrionales bacterium RIFCSPHIGHO2_02_FULL_40_15]
MTDYNPIREKPSVSNFKKGDMLVLFGELFNRGYANGLVEEATKQGLTIVRATVGRRDENQNLRKLTPEEAEVIPKPFINIPLEAGFDLEKDQHGLTPNDYLKDVKLSLWEDAKVPLETLTYCRDQARARFKKQTAEFAAEVEKLIQPGQHVHFAHLMAGGVPRCKIVMPVMNRVFKGTGDRYVPSQVFWESGIGRFLEMNFHEVTAATFNTLIEETTALREKIKSQGGTTSYVAYGYHGTEVIIDGKFKWQSYAPYIQGWAKLDLENYAKAWFKKGVSCCVYNCPEILTNSSSVFQGIEIGVYNLIRALEVNKPNSPLTRKITEDCQKVLKSPDNLKQIFEAVDSYFMSSKTNFTSQFENWPPHSQKEQLELTLKTSDDIIQLHRDEKVLMTGTLSELIFKACGFIMLHEGKAPKKPVAWIGHDAVVTCLEE